MVVALAGCSSVLEGPTQSITLLTPGAENASCMLHNKDFRYEMWTGETRNIQRSEHDLIVDCTAPGNRQKSVIVDNHVTSETYGNVVTAGVGAMYDYYDNSMYEYPAIISVDFRDAKPSSYGLPDYHSKDLPDPSDAPIESYAPGVPKTDMDRYAPQHYLKKIDRDYGRSAASELSSEFGADMGATTAADKAMSAPLSPSNDRPVNLTPSVPGTTADELTRSMNPHVFQ